MSFFKNLFTSQTDTDLKNVIAIINDNFELIVQGHTDERFNVLWFGDYQADPKNLVFWICVQTNAERDFLKTDAGLNRKLRGLFEKYDYPADARDAVQINYESQQTVDRESGGDWHQHLK